MAADGIERQLKAIFSADVKGYSKLMGDDDEATVNTITVYRKTVTQLIVTHQGRVVDSPGDNILAEFKSALNAVKSAVDIQNIIGAENLKLPADRRMDFHIGINLGDILHKKDRIYGDGVNIAARIESLADPGGISISRGVFDQVKKKVKQGFEYLGEHQVKNISEPVRIYRILLTPEHEGKVLGEHISRSTTNQKPYAIAVVAILICSVALLWMYYSRLSDITPASVDKMAYSLPDKPSIAVLPFENMSDDLKQEYFSDGITEEITTALSKTPKMFVIASNSAFTYKGKSVKVSQVAEELGVRYVLEGSVRKAGERVRITAKLIDALSGQHLWAERFDRDLIDIFVVQDEIAKRIITALQVKLTEGEQARYYAKGTDNLEAYLKYLQSLELLRDFKLGNIGLARQLAEEAIALDPDWPPTCGLLGWTHLFDVVYGRTKTPAKSLEQAYELGQKALAMDENSGGAYNLLSVVYMLKKRHKKAIQYGRISVTLNPNSANSYHNLGRLLSYAGKPDEGIPFFRKAIRLNPFAPSPHYYNYAYALWMMGKYQEAIVAGKVARTRGPNDIFSHMVLSVAYIELGQMENARSSVEEILRIKPEITLKWLAKMLPWKKAYLDRFIENLRTAGLHD